MIDDNETWLAAKVLDKLEPIVGHLSDDDLFRFGYWQLRAKCSTYACDEDAITSIERAEELSPDLATRELLQAQLLEWYFLQGELTNVVDCKSDTGGEE